MVCLLACSLALSRSKDRHSPGRSIVCGSGWPALHSGPLLGDSWGSPPGCAPSPVPRPPFPSPSNSVCWIFLVSVAQVECCGRLGCSERNIRDGGVTLPDIAQPTKPCKFSCQYCDYNRRCIRRDCRMVSWPVFSFTRIAIVVVVVVHVSLVLGAVPLAEDMIG